MSAWKIASVAVIAVLGGSVLGLYWVTGTPPDKRLTQAENQAVIPAPEPPGREPAAPVEADREPPRPERQIANEFARVADAYEAGSQYPAYSFPISEEHLQDYEYNQYSPVVTPVSDDGDTARLSVTLEQLHFEKGNPILGTATVSGNAASDLTVNEVSVLDTSGQSLYRQALEANSEGEYELVIRPSESEASEWPVELMVMVSGSFRGRDVDAVAPLRYNDPVGEVASVGDARVEGAHLIIPVDVDVSGGGDYAISGNLYSRDGQPLVHIEHEARLSGFDNSTKLRVHRQALEAKGDEGPYELGDLRLRKLPARPGDRTSYGARLEKRFSIEGASFDEYSDTTYEDPMREARLKFLRNAAEEL